jgi:NAD(P)H-hydrate repair Nnr-like enzyme with NAD(P)H-hydrate dehydratase domain
VLLKGATCVLASPDGRVRTVQDGPDWLATAGSGDVLAGLAGALLAAGLEPPEAGATAVVVHGLAGERASGGGPISAEAVLRAVPATIAALLT